MAEMRSLSCPTCGTTNQPSTASEEIQEYRCRACGLVYYGPAGCDTGDEIVAAGSDPESRLPEDFRMQRPTPVAGQESSREDGETS